MCVCMWYVSLKCFIAVIMTTDCRVWSVLTSKYKLRYLVCCGKAFFNLSIILSQFIMGGSLPRPAPGDTAFPTGAGIVQVRPDICKKNRVINYQLQLLGSNSMPTYFYTSENGYNKEEEYWYACTLFIFFLNNISNCLYYPHFKNGT